MSIRINPCHGCPIGKPCHQRAVFRQKASRLGAVSITFRCQRLLAEIRSGRRVVIPAFEVGQYDWGDTQKCAKAVPATVTFVYPDASFLCVVDPGAIGDDEASPNKIRFRRRMRHTRVIRFLDEPDAPICPNHRVLRNGVCDRAPDNLHHDHLESCRCADEAALVREIAELGGLPC